jgi:uncharacterized protein YbjQ (UPF0145 family)
MREYDRTLSQDEQKAVIGEMQSAAKQKGAPAAPAKAAEKQD